MEFKQHHEEKIKTDDIEGDTEEEWRQWIEEKKRCEEKVKLFDELIQIDGDKSMKISKNVLKRWKGRNKKIGTEHCKKSKKCKKFRNYLRKFPIFFE